MKFGEEKNQQKLTIIPEDGSRFGKRHYLCECGNMKWIRPSNVNSGRVKSCGCLFKNGKAAQKARGTAIDERGKRYGNLKVLMRCGAPKGNHQTGAFWLCLCDCGKQVKIYGGSLRSGKSRSCGKCGE